MKTRYYVTLFSILIILATLISSLQYYHLMNEDAWISYKYAKNLADGFGLVSNRGDVTQEGYSNLFFVLILAFFKWAFDLNIVHVAKIINIISFILIVVLVPKVISQLSVPYERYVNSHNYQWINFKSGKYETYPFWVLSGVIAISIGLSQYLSFWVPQGLETIFYSFMVWVIFYLTLRTIVSNDHAQLKNIAVLSFLCLNTRPEGIMLFFVSTGIIFITALLERKLSRQLLYKLLQSSLIFAILLIVLIAFKFLYFGDILSNPSYVKLAISKWLNPSQYLLDYFNAKGIAFNLLATISFLGSILTCCFLVKNKNGRAIVSTILTFWAFLSSQVFFIYIAGSDYMPASRFIITHYHILAISTIWLLLIILTQLSAWISTKLQTILLFAGCLIVMTSAISEKILGPNWHEVGYISPATIHQVQNTNYAINAAILNEKMAEAPGYYAASEFGYIPYHVKAKGLDMMGLNQKEIARNFKLYDLQEALYANRDFILSKKPVTIVTGHYYRKTNGELHLESGVKWFFKPYIESDFFWKNYTTQIPENKIVGWIYSDWNGKFESTHSINFGDTENYDKLLHGFDITSKRILIAPLARVLLKPRHNDKFINVEGTIQNISDYPDSQNKIKINVNDKAVGDKTYAVTIVNKSGSFHIRVLIDNLMFQEIDTLITLQSDKRKTPLKEEYTYKFKSIYFSK